MAKDLYDKVIEEEKGRGGSKKIYALILVLLVLAVAVGYVFYSGLGGSLFGSKISSPDQAANTLSGLGNDVNNISEGLKDINSRL